MLWISAIASGVRIGIITLVAMRLRRVTPSRIVNPLIKATKAGLGLNINQLESHYLAGGNVDRVVNALIAPACEYSARIRKSARLTWQDAMFCRLFR